MDYNLLKSGYNVCKLTFYIQNIVHFFLMLYRNRFCYAQDSSFDGLDGKDQGHSQNYPLPHPPSFSPSESLDPAALDSSPDIVDRAVLTCP